MDTQPAVGKPANFLSRYSLMAAVMVAIVYGSLYPFAFRDSGSLAVDILHFVGTVNQPPQSRGDLLANLLLYTPLGLTASLALGRDRSRYMACALALVTGAAISLTIELAQYYDVGRVSAFSDFYLNVAGTLAGAGIAEVAGAGLARASWPSGSSPAFARLLLLAWLGWRLYPYVPTIDLHKYWRSVRALLVSDLTAYSTFRYAVLWLSVSFLLQVGLGPRKLTRLLLPAVLCYFAAKILVIAQSPSRPEILGAILAMLLSHLVLERYKSVGIPSLAVSLLLILVLSRVLPWQFATTQKAFQWVPFFGFLHGSLQVNVISFAEKFFVYGVVLLLLSRAGVTLGISITLVCVLLLSTSVLQMFMVARSAEITDALLALVLGGIYALLRRQYPEQAAIAPPAQPVGSDLR